MPIVDLHFTNIGPFDDIAFEFGEHVDVFVGPNNSGKSTVLMVLGDIVG
jgi:DNA repair exonuclease SbcCD ATPase subunit